MTTIDKTERQARLMELREIYQSLRRAGFGFESMAVREILSEMHRFNTPVLGEVLYLDAKATQPVVVMRVEGTRVTYVPLDSETGGTHQGNLFDEHGNTPYLIDYREDIAEEIIGGGP